MFVDRARTWLLTLGRGLLCVVLALAFVTSALNDVDVRIDYATHDRVSDGSHEGITSWFGRGSPRIIKRLVGVDHWAADAAVPDDIALTPSVVWLAFEVEPIVHRSREHLRGKPVRGPPVAFTI